MVDFRLYGSICSELELTYTLLIILYTKFVSQELQ